MAAGSEDGGFTTATAEAAKATTEAQMQARIKDIVEGVVGAGAARVQVTADIDHSRSTTQEQKFDPDGQVVRSSTTNGSQSRDASGVPLGGVTATNNIPGGEAPEQADQASTTAENAETTNYEISNTTTTTVKEPGEVKRLSVSVAVDGNYTPAADGKGEPTYAPRTEEEVAQIRALVAAAVGIDLERGDKLEVVNVRFNRDAEAANGGEAGMMSNFAFDKNDIMRAVELGILALTAAMLIFFVLRPLLKTATDKSPKALAIAGVTSVDEQLVGGVLPGTGGAAAMLPGPSEVEQRIDIARIEGQVKASSIKKVADFVDAHPEESTAILRTWMNEN